jgi:hypothetical protein
MLGQEGNFDHWLSVMIVRNDFIRVNGDQVDVGCKGLTL